MGWMFVSLGCMFKNMDLIALSPTKGRVFDHIENTIFFRCFLKTCFPSFLKFLSFIHIDEYISPTWTVSISSSLAV